MWFMNLFKKKTSRKPLSDIISDAWEKYKERSLSTEDSCECYIEGFIDGFEIALEQVEQRIF